MPPRRLPSLPAQRVTVRPVADADITLVARWVNAGRREGGFLGTPDVDAEDHSRYVRKLTRQGFSQRWLLVEQLGKPIGYLNYVAREGEGELLGLYLGRGARNQHIGTQLICSALGELRRAGCRQVMARVFADNKPSLRACAAAGFVRAPSEDRVSDGRPALALRTKLEPWRYVRAAAGDYARLRGDNYFFEHVGLAHALTERFKGVRGVRAVLGLGSLARGFGDAFSDLDLAVVGHDLAELPWRGERWFGELSVDLFAVDLAQAQPTKWTSVCKQAFEESVVLWSARGFDARAFARSLQLGTRERRDTLCELLFKMGWLGFAPSAWFGKVVHGYRWGLPHDLWIRRGSVESAHITVERVFDALLELLFFLNGERAPDQKWRRYLAVDLPWLPPGFARGLAKIERAPRDEPGFAQRAKALRALIDATVEELESRGDLAGNLYPRLLRLCAEYQRDL